MGFFSAMKGANNVWGTVISADGIGTIGPANLVNNTEHKLMLLSDSKRHPSRNKTFKV